MRAAAVAVAIVLTACGAPGAGAPVQPARETAWRHLATTEGMLRNQAAAEAVQTQQELDRAWRTHGLPREAPPVDFEQNFVLLLGQPDDDCVDQLIGLEVRAGDLRVEWLPPPGGCNEPLVFRIHAVQVDRRHVPSSFDVAFREPYASDARPVTINVATVDGPAPSQAAPPQAMTDAEVDAVFAGHPIKRCHGEPEYMADNGGGSGNAEANMDAVRRWLRNQGYRYNVDFVPFVSRRDGVRPGVLIDNGRADEVRDRLDEVFGADAVDVYPNPYDFQEIDQAQRDIRPLLGGEGPGSIVSSSGIPGPLELGMIDPTRDALDKVASTVDPDLVCVGPILSGVQR